MQRKTYPKEPLLATQETRTKPQMASGSPDVLQQESEHVKSFWRPCTTFHTVYKSKPTHRLD